MSIFSSALERLKQEHAEWQNDVLKHTYEKPSTNREMYSEGDALFAVFRAVNGYYAITESNKTVVGTSLSDVCRDVQAVLADEAARTGTKSSTMGEWEEV